MEINLKEEAILQYVDDIFIYIYIYIYRERERERERERQRESKCVDVLTVECVNLAEA